MNRRRGTLEPVSGATGPAPLEQPAGRARPNRLSRSYRPSQAAEVGSPQQQQTDFRSPTRIPRSRVSAGFSAESPHNESDCQGDIVWDAASPSPLRPGKRGRGASSGAASISEIVSRIAPKHGRPEVTEPTLQQWIGDSAAIACTPTLQDHRPRRTSPRSGVDLLELARQFDLHMFRQDEDELDEMQHQSLELLSEDILDFESGDLNDLSPPGAAAVLMDHHMENDLDILFDGPTQRVSGRLSQVSSQVQPAVISSPREDSGKKPAAACSGAFEDDWDDDDLLNDPLVLEMTQSPQRFEAPRHQSTQKPAGGVKLDRQSAASTAKTGSVTQRTTFKLRSSPEASVRTNQRADHSRRPAEAVAEPSRVSNSRDTGSNTEYDRRKRTTGTTGLSATTSTLSFPKKHNVVPSHTAPAAASTNLDVDLDADLDDFFSSDPVWDDPADDDLLCEMCDDVENQLRSSNDTFSKRTSTSNQRAALQPANQQPVLHKQMPAGGPGGPGGPARVPAGQQVNQTRDSFRFTQTKSSSGSTCSVQSAAAAPQNKDRVDFMTPSDPVTSWTDIACCSAAEIELKKQQAMERRRRRLQASQNLRAPT